jgi:hypothetical protein
MANSSMPEAGGGIARRDGWLIVLSTPPGFDWDRPVKPPPRWPDTPGG